MGQCLAIQEAIREHDLLFSDTPYEEWKELKSRFWNEYVYPKFEEVYFEMFPDEKGEKDNPDRFKGDFNVLDYNQKMAIALCAWLKRDGFFHMFEGEVCFINPDPSDLAFVLTDGVPFRRYPPEYLGTLIERVASDSANTRKKAERLGVWVGGLAIVAGILLWILISIIIRK